MSLWRFFRRSTWDAERKQELASYVQMEADANIARGMSEAEARAAAQRKLGNRTRIREEIYGMNTISVLDTLARDLRYATRSLRRSPTFTLVAIITLALGIGASTAIFTVVNGVLLRPLPYPEPERLVRLWETLPQRSIYRNVVNAWNFLDWQSRTQAFESMAATTPIQTANLSGDGDPVALNGAGVTTNFFDVLHVRPRIGRSFTAEEGILGHSPVVILSHELWQTRFGGDAKILGKKLVLNGSPMLVIGVMPAGFSFPKLRADLWLPLPFDHSAIWEGGRSFGAVARLKPGVTAQQADADLKRVSAQLAQERPGADQGWSAEVIPMLADATGDVRTALLVLLGAVGFLLLIACSNVANLFLMRGAERHKEISLRETLGATRWRVFSQLLTESLIISLLAAALGVAIGQFGLRAVLSLLPQAAALPRSESIALDARVFATAIVLSVATAVFFGLLPLLRFGHADLQQVLRFRPRTASKTIRRTFVCIQVATALVLSVGAGLMTRSFARLIAVNPGFDTEHVVAMSLAAAKRFPNARALADHFEQTVSEVRNAPGVESASTIQFVALEDESKSCFIPPQSAPDAPMAQRPDAEFSVVGPDYFKTMGIPIEHGREFETRDRMDAPSVIVVNRAFASKFFPGEDIVGKKLSVCWTIRNPAEIVGVAGDSRQSEMADAPQPTIFVANLQTPASVNNLIVRAKGNPLQITQAAVSAIHKVNPDQAVSKIRTLKEVVNNSIARPKLQSILLLIFASVALLLASIGVYGVVSYSVAQRTNEIGIRVAIGASRGNIASLVLKEGALLCVIGTAAGLAASFGVTRFLRSLLYEISPADPLTLAMVCGVLAAAAAIAIALPVRRATRVDPLIALRYE